MPAGGGHEVDALGGQGLAGLGVAVVGTDDDLGHRHGVGG
jgi:hypothetical protein